MLAAHHGVIATSVPQTISATATAGRSQRPRLPLPRVAYSRGAAGSRAVTGRSPRVLNSSCRVICAMNHPSVSVANCALAAGLGGRSLSTKIHQPRNLAAQVFAMNHKIDEAMLLQKLAALKPVGQLDLDRIPDGSRPRKTDQCLGLGDD